MAVKAQWHHTHNIYLLLFAVTRKNLESESFFFSSFLHILNTLNTCPFSHNLGPIYFSLPVLLAPGISSRVSEVMVVLN